MAIDTTVGGEDSNSYVTLLESNEYASERGYSLWDDLTNEEKTANLINAAEWIENKYSNLFFGKRTTDTQYLSFPRNIRLYNQQRIANDTIPKKVKYAQIEVAIGLINNDNTVFNPNATSGIKEEESVVGPIEEKLVYTGSTSEFSSFSSRADTFLSIYVRTGNVIRV